MTPPSVRVGLAAASLGGPLGAVARWGLTELFPASDAGFPWATFGINVLGCALLAALPLLAIVRRSAFWPAFLGTGVLGGFTTMSAASVETVALLDAGHLGTGLAYVLGTLACALGAAYAIGQIAGSGQ